MPTKTPRDKALRDVGLAALCGHVRNIRESLGELAEATADGLAEVDTILNTKQNISEPVSLTIPVTGWQTDSSIPGYTHYLDLSVPVILATDVVAVFVAPASKKAAEAANFTNTETMAGVIRLRAEKIPEQAISAEYHIIAAALPDGEAAEESEG